MKHEHFWIRRIHVRHVTVSVSDTDTTLMITLNYVIFQNYDRCYRVVFHVHISVSALELVLSIPFKFFN
jgi:hypothetical protein